MNDRPNRRNVVKLSRQECELLQAMVFEQGPANVMKLIGILHELTLLRAAVYQTVSVMTAELIRARLP